MISEPTEHELTEHELTEHELREALLRIEQLEDYNAMLQRHLDAEEWWNFFWMGMTIAGGMATIVVGVLS